MTDTPTEVLNTDDPTREGNLTAEEYAATYADGEPHRWEPGFIEGLCAGLDARAELAG
jgi:hypothetical protein